MPKETIKHKWYMWWWKACGY